MKKGFTIIELLQTIAILATIFIVIISLYQVAIREYSINFQKIKIQTSLNFATDSIAQTAKMGLALAPSYGEFTRSAGTVIIEVPALDESGNFIYSGSAIEKDYIIYQLEGGNLEKRIYGNSLGRYANQHGEPNVILKNVTNFSCNFSNQVSGRADYYKTLTFNVTTKEKILDKEISFNVTKTVNLRNAP